MHSFHYNHGTLHCEEVDLAAIAKEVGTPAYVYSATTVLENYRRLNQSLNPLDRMICYAAKANSNLAILGLLAKEGAGFDIVSGGELFKVLKAGGRADRCTFAGVGKMVFEIEYALKQGIYCFNVESEGELELINEVAERLGCVAPIALRVNPDVDAPTHHYISTGKSKNKFGIGLDRAEAVYARAAALPHLKIRGLQTHIGSQILDAAPFAEAVHKLTPLVRKLQKLYGLEFFSLGGGVGIVYRGALASGDATWWSETEDASSEKVRERLAAEDYAAQVIEPLRALGLRILFEPGRFIVGNAGVLLTTALYRKTTPAKNFLIVDAGMNDLIRPALYQGYHEIEPLREPVRVLSKIAYADEVQGVDGAEKFEWQKLLDASSTGATQQFTAEVELRKNSIDRPLEKIDIVGPVCESGDFFAQDRIIPRVEPGEQVALMSTGAYGLVMGSNYNARPMPPEVLVEGKKATVVRRRQTWEDLISLEVHIRPTGQI